MNTEEIFFIDGFAFPPVDKMRSEYRKLTPVDEACFYAAWSGYLSAMYFKLVWLLKKYKAENDKLRGIIADLNGQLSEYEDTTINI